MMKPLEQELLLLEEDLQVPSFSNDDALVLGLCAVDWIRESGKPGVFIEIRRGENTIFSYCMGGANPDNRLFADRKLRTVAMFEHCSMYAGEKYESKGRKFEDFYPPQEYQCKGGGFPIAIPGTGMVGMIGVSGLSAQEDHEVCVMALRKFLNRQKGGVQ
ncbi:MAG: heme-binding protein [Lachnospiraceae bacterium]|nr:heme-binding protein [Lachnospiraceae bacterium]